LRARYAMGRCMRATKLLSALVAGCGVSALCDFVDGSCLAGVVCRCLLLLTRRGRCGLSLMGKLRRRVVTECIGCCADTGRFGRACVHVLRVGEPFVLELLLCFAGV
jgi:hypothetical protein